jgi:hypothetical protein
MDDTRNWYVANVENISEPANYDRTAISLTKNHDALSKPSPKTAVYTISSTAM